MDAVTIPRAEHGPALRALSPDHVNGTAAERTQITVGDLSHIKPIVRQTVQDKAKGTTR